MIVLQVDNGHTDFGVGSPNSQCTSLSAPFQADPLPENSTASIMAVQVGGGWTCSSQISNISTRHRWGSCGYFSVMPASFPFGIIRWIPIIFHLSATLWYRAFIRSFNCGVLPVCPSNDKHKCCVYDYHTCATLCNI